MTTATKLKLHTMLGNYPITKAHKSGAARSDLVNFDFAEVKVANNLFKRVVREADQVLGLDREVERGFASRTDPYRVADRLFDGVVRHEAAREGA